MKAYTVHEAKTQLSKLIQEALAGEEVIITNRHTPMVRLQAVERLDRMSLVGDLKGKIWVSDDFDDTPADFAEYT